MNAMNTETVLITGASSGIGLELAKCFAADGCRLILVARNRDAMEKLAEELRRMPGMSHAVLVAVSGYGQEADKQRSQAVGFAQHLTKPVDLVQLKQVLTTPRGQRM